MPWNIVEMHKTVVDKTVEHRLQYKEYKNC